jgi:hypothetical protein
MENENNSLIATGKIAYSTSNIEDILNQHSNKQFLSSIEPSLPSQPSPSSDSE